MLPLNFLSGDRNLLIITRNYYEKTTIKLVGDLDLIFVMNYNDILIFKVWNNINNIKQGQKCAKTLFKNSFQVKKVTTNIMGKRNRGKIFKGY